MAQHGVVRTGYYTGRRGRRAALGRRLWFRDKGSGKEREERESTPDLPAVVGAGPPDRRLPRDRSAMARNTAVKEPRQNTAN